MRSTTKSKPIFTYLLKSGQHYKVGHTRDLDKRLATYRAHNPHFEVMGVIEGNHESEVIAKFKAHNGTLAEGRNEWFSVPRRLRRGINEGGLTYLLNL